MKRAILVHGWEGRPDAAFRPWLRRELEARGYGVSVPAMPNPDFPDRSEWLAALSAAVGEPDEKTVLVGHSLGCRAILLYLAGLPEGQKIGKAVMVAGLADRLEGLTATEREFIRPWFDSAVDAGKVRRSAHGIVSFYSDGDPFLDPSEIALAAEKYGAQLRFEPGMGHFSDADGVTEAPEILAAILE